MDFTKNILMFLWVFLFVINVITGDYIGAIGALSWAAALAVSSTNYALCVVLELVACLFLGISCFLIGSMVYIAYAVIAVAIVFLALLR